VTAAVLTPFTGSAATELGNRRWLKRLLPVGEISYQGRVLKFTRDYLGGLVDAFHSRAYDQVPFQLAGDSNKHTNDVERFGGKITDMSLRNDGLYIELDPTERGERVLRDNPGCGVSARIVESYERADGKFYPKAIQHVLATLDPRIPALGGWQSVDAANDVDITFDLSTASFATEETAMPELTEEQQGKLAELLKIPADKLAKLVAGLTADDLSGLTGGEVGGDGNEDELSDEELDALIDEALALEAAGLLGEEEPATQGEPVTAGAGLANDQQAMAVELAQAGVDENTRQLGIITAQLDNERWQNERAKLVSRGVPPYIADLAQPLLEGSAHTVELSGGKFVDAGQITRKILDEYTKIGEQLGLGVELGTTMDVPDDVTEDARDSVIKRAKRDMGLIR
jgi:hypothetical protein